MPLTLPELRTLAWRTFDCDFCGEKAGRRCVTASDVRTTPHKSRIDQARGWDARQPEVDSAEALAAGLGDEMRDLMAQVDTLQAELKAKADSLTKCEAECRSAREDAASLAEQLKTARAGAALVPGLRDQIADLLKARDLLMDDHDKLLAEFEAYKAAHPDAPEPEPTSQTLFGACPASPGGTSLAAQRAPFLKYGKPLTVRQFFGTEVAPRAPKSEVLRLHASWNLGSMTVADLTSAWVDKVTANLLPGDEVEVIHEADKKVTDGKRTYEDCVAYKNKFADLVEDARPDLLVVNTLTGGTLADYGGDKEERWGVVKAHLLGVDCDGVHDKTAPLNIPYEDEMASAQAFVKKYAANGYRGIVIPEFGTSRPAYDADGRLRAAWIARNAAIFAAAGVLEVNAYEYESTAGNEFKAGSPEYDTWRGLVATNTKESN